jgi:lysine 2,3-aminomutase
MTPSTRVPRAEAAVATEAEAAPPSRRSFRALHWPDVDESRWQDWRWQQQNAIRSTRDLARLLPMERSEFERLSELEEHYKLAIPPYYFDLIDPDDAQDPIRLQSVPRVEEAAEGALDDPLEEDQDAPVPGLTHRYPDRVLILTTPVCSMYCRFCTRKRVTMMPDGWDGPSHDELRMLDYVRQHPEIHDVILSGGDPLMLKLEKLRWFLTELKAIEHVGVVRIGTRVPVTLPQRLFDSQLIDALAEGEKVWIQTHFNHPAELTAEAARACSALSRAGLPLNNHSVLLKGVNDSVETMRALMRGLLRMKVRPYYIFHCDPVVGTAHFRTSLWKGIEIMEGLRGHVSGLAVPTYVVDGMHGAGKIPLMPNYMVSAAEDAVVLRNYEGVLFRYAPEGDGFTPAAGAQGGSGVSALLSGERSVMVPQSVPRLQRRANRKHVAGSGKAPPAKPLSAKTPGAKSVNGRNGTGRAQKAS